MGFRKIVWISLAIILILPLVVSCTEEQQDQAFMNEIDKMFGNTPTPTETDRYDLNLTINLEVYKSVLGPNDPTNAQVPAYPQSIVFHVYRQNKGKIFDIKDVEKWTDKQGKIAFNMLFSRVYIEDVISVSYKPKLVEYDFGLWREKSEMLVTVKDIASSSRYDEKNKRYNLTLPDYGWLSPVLPATAPAPLRSATATPTKSP